MVLALLRGIGFFMFVIFMGCSDQPDQKKSDAFIIPNPSSPSLPGKAKKGVGVESLNPEDEGQLILVHTYGKTPTEFRLPRVNENNADDDKIEKNGKAPIVFNGAKPLESSVAGVRFNMLHEEASNILSTPIVGGCGSSGDYYQENLCLKWSAEEPRRLRQVLILDGYLGAIEFPSPLGKVEMKSELQDKFTKEQGELGEEILIKTYNKFFSKSKETNCLETNVCQAVLYNDYINWIMPNITIVFSKDRKVLIQMIINQDVQPGDFSNPFDLIKGEINIKSTGSVLKLGEEWGNVQSKLQTPADPPSILETSSYRKDFVGMLARVERKGVYNSPEEFSLNQIEPLETDKFIEFVVYSNFKQPIMLNGKYVEVEFKEQKVSLSLVTERPDDKKMLSVRMDFLAQNIELQKEVLKQLGKLIKKEFKSLSSDSVVRQSFSGFKAKNSPNRRMVLRTGFYDFSKKQGVSNYISISKNNGGMVFIASLNSDPTSIKSMSTVKDLVDFKGGELSGVSLGEEVKISKVDKNRSEAFLTIDGHTLRVKIDIDASVRVSTEDSVVERLNIIEVVGVNGVALGLTPDKQVAYGTQEFSAKVVFIGSSLNTKSIKNVCGLKEARFKIGMSQRSFKMKLKRALKAEGLSCSVFAGPDESGDGRARVYYFPKMGAKIYFNENTLSGIQKYRKISGGN